MDEFHAITAEPELKPSLEKVNLMESPEGKEVSTNTSAAGTTRQ
jgi:hypothetical protein